VEELESLRYILVVAKLNAVVIWLELSSSLVKN